MRWLLFKFGFKRLTWLGHLAFRFRGNDGAGIGDFGAASGGGGATLAQSNPYAAAD